MTDDLKSSARVWGGKTDSEEDSPPAYAPEESATSNTNLVTTSSPAQTISRRPVPRSTYDPLKKLSALAIVPYHKYNIPDGTLSPDKIILTVKHSELYSQPRHLIPFVLEQACLPPKPTLRIIGSHCGDRIDFDITLNLTHLLNFSSHKWRFNSAQVSPLQSGIGGSRTLYDREDPRVMKILTTGVNQFCKDRGENRSYTLTRTVEGFPTETLAGQVRNLAASVKYRGLLRIDFTDERSKIVVHKQPSSWFSNVLRLHPEKKFEMAETVWDLTDPSDEEKNINSADAGLRAGQEWWKSWQGTIRNAIIVKHKGNLGIEDWIETKMGRVEPEPRTEWGRDHQM